MKEHLFEQVAVLPTPEIPETLILEWLGISEHEYQTSYPELNENLKHV